MKQALLLPALLGLVALCAGCGSASVKDVFEEEEILSLRGELAGAVEYKTVFHFLVNGDRLKGEDGGNPVTADWTEVSRDFSGAVREFGLFQHLVELDGLGPDISQEEILERAKKDQADLVVILEPVKLDVRYEGRNFLLWGLDLILWTFLWFPAYLVPDEVFSAEMEMELRVLDAFSGREIYRKNFRGRKERAFDDFSRGFGFLDIWSPLLAQWTLGDANLQKVSESLLPHALSRIKKDLLMDLGLEFHRALQTPELKNKMTPKTRRLFAVVVAPERPASARTRGTRFTSRDAEAVWTYLETRDAPPIDPEGSTLLTGKDASVEGIREALAKIRSMYPRPDDDVIFYFSGLGAVSTRDGKPEPVLAASDTDSNRIGETTLPLASLMEDLAGLGTRRVALLVDAGFGRRKRGRSLGASKRGVKDPALPGLPGNDADWFLAIAGSEGDTVMEVRTFGHGLMTHYLLEALEGKADLDGNGEVTLAEIEAHLAKNMPQMSGMVGAPQEPWVKMNNADRVLIPPVPEEPSEEPGGEEPAGEPGGEEPSEEPGGEEPAGEPGGEEPAGEPGGEEPAGEPGGEEPAGEPGEEPAGEPGGEEPPEEPGEEPAGEPGGEEPSDDSGSGSPDERDAEGGDDS